MLVVTSLAGRLGATAGYLLVVLFWLVGAAAMALYMLRGGVEAARRPLDWVSEPGVPVAPPRPRLAEDGTR